MYLFDKRKKLINDWNKGNLSAQGFVDEMNKKKLNWNDVEQLDEDDQSSDAPKPGKQNGRLALIALLMAIASLLLLSGLGWWTHQQLAQQSEGLAKVRENVENVPRITPQAVEKAKARISALETAVAPEPVEVRSVELLDFPQPLFAGDDPVELRFRVQGQNIAGKTLDFDIKPNDLASLVQPHSGIVVGDEITLILDPQESGTIAITPHFEEKIFDTYSVTITPLPQIEMDLVPKQIVMEREYPLSIAISNNSTADISAVVVECDMPDWIDVDDPQDFLQKGETWRSYQDAMQMGERITKTIVVRSGQTFELSCRVMDENDHVFGEKSWEVSVVSPEPSRIELTPTSLELGVSMTSTVVATTFDQMDAPVSGITVTWQIEPSDIGEFEPNSIETDKDGIASTNFTALSVGEGNVIVEVPNIENNPVRTSIPVTIYPVATVKSEKNVNLRVGPGVIYPQVALAHPGEQFMIVGKYGNWWQVKSADEAQVWIFSDKVEIEGNTNDVLEVNLPPGRWTLKPLDGSGQVDLFDEGRHIIAKMPPKITLYNLVSVDQTWATAEPTLWVQNEYVGDDHLNDVSQDVRACWVPPLDGNESQCGTLTPDANNMPLMEVTEEEQGGWKQVRFRVWIKKENLTWTEQ